MWNTPPRPTTTSPARWALPLLLACLVSLSTQQRDPIKNFCRRWGHQAAVVDDKLYIDGGLLTYSPSDGTPENLTNPYLIFHDLSSVASSDMPPPYANLSKNSTIPVVHGGVLWPDDVNKRIYLFGGEFYEETPWPFSLYSYDVLNDQWDDWGSPRSTDLSGIAYGAGVSISSRGQAYYYGGWINNATTPGWGETPGMLSSHMLQYNMDDNTWTNTTGPDDRGRAEGVMVYIPAGDAGLLVYFGGIRTADEGDWEAQPMDEIILYDILSGKSYFQNATGHVPELRRKFCAGATWVEDQSSYNIYLYGGAGEAEGSIGFDDIYVLSLPTFTWVRIYPTDKNTTGDYPHHSLTCNVINEAQMIVHGGFFPLTNDCDAAPQWGLHNMDLGKQNKDKSPWATWEPDKTDYVVPTDIIAVVGGKPTGGATNREPEDGFMHRDVKAFMTRFARAETRTPTRDLPGETSTAPPDNDDDKPVLSTGAIIGIGVGGGVLLVILLGACIFFIRRSKKNKAQAGQPPKQPMVHRHDYNNPPYMDGSSNQLSPGGPWSPHSSSYSPGYSPGPPPFQARPPTHIGPPVELPSDNNAGAGYYSTEPKHDGTGTGWEQQYLHSQSHSPVGSGVSPYENAMPPLLGASHTRDTSRSSPDVPAYSPVQSPRRKMTPQELSNDTQRHLSTVSSETTTQAHHTYYNL